MEYPVNLTGRGFEFKQMKAMKIGLIQVDGKLPNLALMKIASFHKRQGDEVEWWVGPLFKYSKVYASKIFKFSDLPLLPANAIIGGTGVNWSNRLPDEIDIMNPGEAWWLYPDYKNHLGFSELGCRFECSFCCVPQKEGKPRNNSTIQDLMTNPKGDNRLVLLDDDFFGQLGWREKAEEIISLKLRVCFSQGLNIRVITEDQANLLAKMNFWSISFSWRSVSFSWDRFKDYKLIKKGFERCVQAGIKPYQMQFFVLIGYDTTEAQDLDRVETLKSWGCDPFVMAFDRTIPYQRRFQRWVNHKAIFKSVKWREYLRPAC